MKRDPGRDRPGKEGDPDHLRYGIASDPPVGQDERIAEMLATLEVGGVARHQLQAVLQGDGDNHRICGADGLAARLQVAFDFARQLACRLVKNIVLCSFGLDYHSREFLAKL
jgi:hypothetical protein